MKRIYLLFCILLAALTVQAYDFSAVNDDGVTIYYNNKSDGTCEVTYKDSKYNSYSGIVKIPSVANGRQVTSIGSSAFSGCSGLTTLTIPEGVTSISFSAFQNCSGLTTITIPEGVTSIGSFAFYGCSGLTTLTIPEGVTSIAQSAFSGCSGLTTLTIPEGVTSISFSAFSGCSGLQEVHINDISAWCKINFSDSGSNPLYYAHNLYLNDELITELVIPDDVTSIRSYAFYGCSGLTTLTIPEGITSIGSGAFFGCSGLTTLTIPESVTSIGSSAFSGCSGLTSITISGSIASISSDAFSGCGCVLRLRATTPGTYAYSNCVIMVPKSALVAYKEAWPEHAKEIISDEFPNPLTLNVEACVDESDIVRKIDEMAENLNMTEMDALLSVTNLKLIGSINSYDVMVLHNKMLNLMELDLSEVDVVANSYEYYTGYSTQDNKITRHFLGDFKKLKTVKLPNSATIIEGYAIESSSPALANIIIGSNTETINQNAFRGITTIRNVEIGEGVKSIGNYAFYGCSGIRSINTGVNTKSIGYLAFYNCSSLKSVEIGKNTTSIGTNVFEECTSLASVTVHDDAAFAISNYAFKGCTSLKEISTGKSVTSIGPYAFQGCKALQTVEIGDGTQSIGTEAFKDLKALQNVTMGTGMKSIGNKAFYGCSALTNLTLGENVETIGDYAFQNCSGIVSLGIPKGMLNINQYAFAGCSALREVGFAPGLKTIGQYAFQNCSSLEQAILPTTLESIGTYAFSGCTALSNVKIPTSMNSIANYAFNANNVRSVYTWTIQPTNIDQNTFASDAYTKGILWVPETAKKLYFYNTQWSKFVDIRTFVAPYRYFYLTDEDLVIDEETPRLKGGEDEEFIDGMLVDADLSEGSALVVEGDESQDLGEVNLDCNGTDSASLIGGTSATEQSGSNININDLKINIKITKNKWYFFCFPFDITPEMIEFDGQFVWRWYDGNERALNGRGGWKNVVGNLTSGQGYIFQGSVNGTLTLHIGRAHIGAEFKHTTILPHAADNAAHASWNFIGNPYTSYYDICDLGFSAPVTVWNGSTYVAYHPDDDKYMLHPYQAFFVQKPESSENVDFDPMYRFTLNQSTDEVYKEIIHNRHQARARRANATGKRQFINLELAADSVIDCTRVVFNNDRTMGYEVGCDAAKFMSDKVAQIYTLDFEDNSYSINERPCADYNVRLGFTAPAAGNFTISATREDVEMEIYDKKTGRAALLSAGYSFSADEGTDNDRFILRLPQETNGVDAIDGAEEDGENVEYIGIDGVNYGKKVNRGISIEKRGNTTRKVMNR